MKKLTRKNLITKILHYSSDEFESKEDFINLAIKTKKELINDLYHIINNK